MNQCQIELTLHEIFMVYPLKKKKKRLFPEIQHLLSLEVFVPVVGRVAIVAFRFVVRYLFLFDLLFKVFALSVSVSMSPAVQHVVR